MPQQKDDYLTILCSFGLQTIITNTITGVTGNSSTCIDHIAVNHPLRAVGALI